MIDADAAGFDGDQLSIRAHAQKGEENADHAGNRQHKAEKRRHHIAEKHGDIEEGNVQSQKKLT